MNRIEFMTKLASLLQDVPAEERKEAMKYYNDYFDDAGAENEAEVIRELGSPEKVAATLKESIDGYSGIEGEFTDSGYREPKFEQQEVPGPRVKEPKIDDTPEKKERWRSKPLKIVLIVVLILCAAPVALPIITGILAAIAGCILAVAAVLIGIVIASAAVVVAAVMIAGAGFIHLFSEFAIGLALIGTGLILLSLGAIATVASVQLCTVVFPAIVKGIVWLWKKLFQRKAVA